jgi:hypothetical protein
MIIKSTTRTFEDFDTQSFVTTSKLLEILKKRNEFKKKLMSIFKIHEEETKIIKIGNSKSLIDSIFEVDSKFRKVDIKSKIKDIHLKKLLKEEKAEFEIFNVKDNYILKNNKSDLLIGETTYSAKSDLLDYYNFSKFANYCRDKDFKDLIDRIKEYLIDKNSENKEEKSLRLIHKFEDDKYYIRAVTSTNGYQDFGINFSVFVALIALDDYVKKSNNEIYINKFKVDDSHIYISFALKDEVRVNDKITLSFNLILENDEIKRGAVSFNGIFKLKWEEDNKKSEIFLKPTGVKKDDKNHPVDLLTYQHRGDVKGVFDKIQKLPELINFFIDQVSDDAKRISNISHPDDIRKFIRDKVKNSRKAEFQIYKHEILKKLMNISVNNTFKLFELLREIEDLFEHDDIVSINFWRTKLYESLIEKK